MNLLLLYFVNFLLFPFSSQNHSVLLLTEYIVDIYS